jgi:hypothetical protein
MIGYVVAGYSIVFGTLGLYAFRTIVRSRQVAARLLASEDLARPLGDDR